MRPSFIIRAVIEIIQIKHILYYCLAKECRMMAITLLLFILLF